MYEVIQAFPERYDEGHEYSIGDTYPREGFTPPDGRVQELLDGTNRARNVYLRAVVDMEDKPDAPVEDKPRARKKKE